MDNDERALRLAVLDIALTDIFNKVAASRMKHKRTDEYLQHMLKQDFTVEQRMNALDEYKQAMSDLSGVEELCRAAKRMLGELEEAE